MKINEQQKKQIKKHIYKIDKMDKQELHKFAQDLYLAKEDLDAAVFKWTLRAIDIREVELQDIISSDVVISELVMGEIE